MKRSGAIGNEVAVTRRHIGEYDANRRLDIRDIRKITKDLILVNNEVSTKFGGVAQPEASADVASLLEQHFTVLGELELAADKISVAEKHWCRIYGKKAGK